MKVTLALVILAGLYACMTSALPSAARSSAPSEMNGLAPSAAAPSFMPVHVTGPNAAKRACPVCIYGNQPQLQLWVQEASLQKGLQLAELAERDLVGLAQAYVVLVPARGNRPSEATLRSFREKGLKSTFFTYVPSWSDKETSGLYNHKGGPKPEIRLYSVVNRRLFARWDNPEQSEWTQIVKAVKESTKYKEQSSLTDQQIAPAWEPGQRFKVAFEVFDRSGKPLKGIKVTAWQTDSGGLYNPKAFGHIAPRLQVTAWTDQNGRIEFDTIYPGPYPDQPEPSHIHFAIPVNGVQQWRTLWFEGDPRLTTEKRKWERENEETVIVNVDKSESPWKTYHRYIAK